jgi:hypothetical protein
MRGARVPGLSTNGPEHWMGGRWSVLNARLALLPRSDRWIDREGATAAGCAWAAPASMAGANFLDDDLRLSETVGRWAVL